MHKTSLITHQTAMCLLPPEKYWQEIQSIRSIHDKAYRRWMPHINLIYPFFPEADFDQIRERLEVIFQNMSPFVIEFDASSVNYFKQKGQECTFHLRPKETQRIAELHDILMNELFKDKMNSTPFEAHLTLGQTTKSRISDIMIEMKAKWSPIKFTIDRISMISRGNDPNDQFTVKKQIFLLARQEKDVTDVPHVNIPVEMPAVDESSSMNIPLHSSINPSNMCLCIIPPDEFSTRLIHFLAYTPSFRSSNPFRIILKEYQLNTMDSDLTTHFAAISKFSLEFGARSICFNYSTFRLFLKPNNLSSIKQLGLSDHFDGTLTLGQIDKNDLTDVANQFTERWIQGANEFEVDRVHLMDSNGRFHNYFLLKGQCFS
jgi:RNA 2',3'-cyclic 3'-phosphodiesterase